MKPMGFGITTVSENGLRRVIVSCGGRKLLSAGVTVNPAMRLNGETPGMIGWLESESMPSAEAAAALFDAAAAELKTGYMIGPMNGSTWEDYRVPEPGGRSFPLDCRTPDWWGGLFEACGFETVARYVSTRIELDESAFARYDRMKRCFAARGITVEEFDPGHGRELLAEVYALSCESFRNNFLYTPIPEAVFTGKYLPLMARMDPRYVLLARNAAGKLLAFMLAFENRPALGAHEMILKTLAAAPGGEARGLGAFLVEMVHRRAFDSGYRTVCHALMHEHNMSGNIGGVRAKVCRRYKLYGRKI